MAGQGIISIDAYNDPKGFVNISSASLVAAVGFASIPDHAEVVYVQAEGGDIRYRDDGTDPTAVIGTLLPDGAMLKYTGNMRALKFISAAGTPKLNISFYA